MSTSEEYEKINSRMRELAHLSVLITPDLQMAPQERQRARRQTIALNPVHEAPHAILSPMAQRTMESKRRKMIEDQRDELRDAIVEELQTKYLTKEDRNYLFPERNAHFDIHKIQFPAKPFLPVEVNEQGQGMEKFPRVLPSKPRCRRRSGKTQDSTEVQEALWQQDDASLLQLAASATSGRQQYCDRGGSSILDTTKASVLSARALERAQAEKHDMEQRVRTWKKRQHQKTRNDLTSIFSDKYNNLRSGAASIETKHGIPKSSSMVPLSGINAAEATMLGPVAPFGPGRRVLYEKNPKLLQEKERSVASFQASMGFKAEPRTEYERLLSDTFSAPRERVIPVRGTYFKPPVPNPRVREVMTHGADVLEESARKLPMPPDSMRRVQILSSGTVFPTVLEKRTAGLS